MSKGRIQHVIAHYRDQLLHHEQQAERALNHAYITTLARVQPDLNRLYQQIADKQQAGEDIPLAWLYESKRLETIKHLIIHQINLFGATAQRTVAQGQHTGLTLGMQAAQAQLAATVPAGVHWTFVMLPHKAIESMVGATRKGSPLADLFAGFGKEAAAKVHDVLVIGISLGHGPARVARDVQQALGISRNRALTISRTELLRAYRMSSLETMRTNDDVVRGWVWDASLGANTCAACIFMSGSEHSLDEEMESHVCCRCVQAPLTRNWSDILGDTDIDTSDIEETSIDVQDGSEWFDQQSTSTQRQILGEARYKAYQRGVPLKSMVGHVHDRKWGSSIYVKPAKALARV